VIEIRPVVPLRADQSLAEAVVHLVRSELPALPVVDEADRFAGVFGEREFIRAIFPAYLDQIHHAGAVSRLVEELIERRASAADEPVSRSMFTDHVDVGPDFSDLQIAERFLHHRVLVIPVVDDGRVLGVVTRRDFFLSLAGRFDAQ
jgi:CBS domain-containing protein